MNQDYYRRLNPTQTIENSLPIIIEAFVTVYGESERETITEKFKNLLVVGYSKPSGIASIITADKAEKSDKLIDKFLNDLKVPEESKKQMKTLFFSNSSLEHLYSHKIYLYTLYKSGDNSDYYKQQSVKFLSELYPSLNITIDNLDELIQSGKFSDLETTIEHYNQVVAEYQEYLKSIEPYTTYVAQCEKLEKGLDTKYTKELIDSLKDLFTPEELKQIEENYNSSYPSPVQYLNAATRNILNYNLGNASLIESFNEENEDLLMTGNKFQIQNIKNDRIAYFKNLGIDLGKDYEAYLQDPRVQQLMPSVSTAQRVTDVRLAMYTKKMNEYYQTIQEYQRNRERIDALSFLDKDDGYNANAYENAKTCINTNIRKTVNGYVMYPILYFYVNNYDTYLDPHLIHELNHVYELHLDRVEDDRYYGTCGWDIIDTAITKSRATEVSLEDRKEKRKYELFNEIINELISQEICQVLFDQGYRVFNSQDNTKVRGGTSYEYTLFLVRDFYQTYKKEIFESRKTGDMSTLFELIGKENFEALNLLFHEYYEYFPGMTSFTVRQQLMNNQDTELTRKYLDLLSRSKTIMSKMQEHSQKRKSTL